MTTTRHFEDGWDGCPDRGSGAEPCDLASGAAGLREALGPRSIVLVGMMGAGKTSVGRRLALALDLPFVDADAEIEARAGMTIPELFEKHGEPYFRAGEARVIARLLEGGPQVLATGGGAWMNPETRERVAAAGVSVWLKAEIDVLLKRVRKRANRPLLASADPEATLRALAGARYPVYALADLSVVSRDTPHDHVVAELIAALRRRLIGEACEEKSS
ncbi:MAG TPA: shikimate kinase [Hansschlegelia sp.]